MKKLMLCPECRKMYEDAKIRVKRSGSAMDTMTTCAECRRRKPRRVCEVGK